MTATLYGLGGVDQTHLLEQLRRHLIVRHTRGDVGMHRVGPRAAAHGTQKHPATQLSTYRTTPLGLSQRLRGSSAI